jgi:chromosome segregation ATPase
LNQEIFLKLQSYSKYVSNPAVTDFKISKINLKKILILSKINSACNNIFQIYKLSQLKRKQKYFQYWKNIALTKKIEETLDKKISEKISKLYESKINNLNKELKTKQKNLEELKESEKALQSSNKQMEKEKDLLIKNRKKLAQKIEQIEKENAALEKEKKNKNNININTYQNFYSSKKDDEKIKELEKKLKELEEEEIDRKSYLDEYSEEMGKIMGVFEQKAKEIMRLQDNGQIRRRMDNNNNTNTGNSTNPNTDIFNDDIFNRIMENK